MDNNKAKPYHIDQVIIETWKQGLFDLFCQWASAFQPELPRNITANPQNTLTTA